MMNHARQGFKAMARVSRFTGCARVLEGSPGLAALHTSVGARADSEARPDPVYLQRTVIPPRCSGAFVKSGTVTLFGAVRIFCDELPAQPGSKTRLPGAMAP